MPYKLPCARLFCKNGMLACEVITCNVATPQECGVPKKEGVLAKASIGRWACLLGTFCYEGVTIYKAQPLPQTF
jgi:hypothetical protein